MSTLFLSGAKLADAIGEIIEGEELRCAVAFWGKDLAGRVNRLDTRIICDVSMGGTDRGALEALGVPNNKNVRHIHRFHPKVFFSSNGAVIGSANASLAALGNSSRGPVNEEAGVKIEPDDPQMLNIISWFEDRWAIAKQVDELTMQMADNRYLWRAEMACPRNVRDGSLLDQVISDPNLFSNVTFVFPVVRVSKQDRNAAESDARSSFGQDMGNFGSGAEVFANWEASDIDNWQSKFFEFWMPADRLEVFARRRLWASRHSGFVVGSGSDYTQFQRELPALRGLTKAAIEQADVDFVRKLRGEAGAVFSSFQISERLRVGSSEL